MFSHGRAEWDTDLIFKKPFTLSDQVRKIRLGRLNSTDALLDLRHVGKIMEEWSATRFLW
jgi:hypothetical protein